MAASICGTSTLTTLIAAWLSASDSQNPWVGLKTVPSAMVPAYDAATLRIAAVARPSGRDVLPRLEANLRGLSEAYRFLADDVHRGVAIPPAAEWLLDNFYLIEEQIRTAKRHLPKGYSRGLPRLAKGPSD